MKGSIPALSSRSSAPPEIVAMAQNLAQSQFLVEKGWKDLTLVLYSDDSVIVPMARSLGISEEHIHQILHYFHNQAGQGQELKILDSILRDEILPILNEAVKLSEANGPAFEAEVESARRQLSTFLEGGEKEKTDTFLTRILSTNLSAAKKKKRKCQRKCKNEKKCKKKGRRGRKFRRTCQKCRSSCQKKYSKMIEKIFSSTSLAPRPEKVDSSSTPVSPCHFCIWCAKMKCTSVQWLYGLHYFTILGPNYFSFHSIRHRHSPILIPRGGHLQMTHRRQHLEQMAFN